MSDDIHPDLDLFYDPIDPGDEDELWEDDPDDEDYIGPDGNELFDDLYVDDEDDEDEDDMEIDEDEDDEDEEEDDDDEDGGNPLGDALVVYPVRNHEDGEDYDDDDDDDEIGGRHVIDLSNIDASTLVNIAQMLNQPGTSSEARQSLLARLLLGPTGAGAGAGGGGGGLGRRSQRPQISPEERQRRAAEKRKRDRWWSVQVDPHPKGLELLRSGDFGRVGDWTRYPKASGSKSSRMDQGYKRSWTAPRPEALVPNTQGTIVATYPSIPYVGQYAGEDYGLFYSATQAFTLHLYDTSKSRAVKRRARPRDTTDGGTGSSSGSPETTTRAQLARNDDDDDDDSEDDFVGMGWGGSGMRRRGIIREDTSMKRIKQVRGVDGRWTVTDCDVDRKGERMIYSSITPYVHMVSTSEDDSEHIELDFTSRRQYRSDSWGGYDSFGIWSIRFSADGREVVAGAGNGKILVYDIEARSKTLAVQGHGDDVNAVCFADEASTNILVSGSDDGFVKVWDRRSLSSNTASGVLVGATEGITYASPKGDGRYIVVNSKDQAARLYDLRKMRDPGEFRTEPDAVRKWGQNSFDYRDSRYPRPSRLAHPKDCSIMTYRGHSVLRTLIRCHFSPRESTGQSYIYSGSADGLIHIWSLDGRVVQVLNRAESTPLRDSRGNYNDPSATERERTISRYGALPYEMGQSWTVRDVSWHGYEPTLMSTCWEVDGGFRRGGTIAKHEWKGLGKNGFNKLEDWVERKKAECS